MKIITGTGRSGTSFVAALLAQMGYDVGANSYNMTQPPYAGLEAPTVNHINMQICADLEALDEMLPSLPTARRLAQKYQRMIGDTDIGLPKDPRFTYTLRIWAQVKPIDLVIVCVRDIHLAFQSSIESNTLRYDQGSYKRNFEHMAARLGYLISVIVTENIPFVILHFPEIVNDREVLWDQLSAVLDFRSREIFDSIFDQLAKPELVHFKNHDRSNYPAFREQRFTESMP